jgi:hypothetical protein
MEENDSQRKDFALLSAEMHNLIKMFRTDKNCIKTIVQCTTKVKWILDKRNQRYSKSVLRVRNVDLWRNCKIIVVNSLKLRLRAKRGRLF